MKPSFLKKLKKFCYQLAEDSSEKALRLSKKNFSAEFKKDASPVTVVDRKLETFLRDKILKEFPDHQVIGEEFGASGNENAEFRWWLDPIDGTAAFIRGLPTWGSVIGCEYQGQVIGGSFSLPCDKKIFAAAKNQGCHLNKKRKLRFVRKPSLKSSSFHYGGLEKMNEKVSLRLNELSKKTADQRGWGDVYSYGFLLEGKTDAMLDFIVEAYDISAMQICVEEAGGVFRSMSGKKSIHERNALSACTAELHRELSQFLHD